MLGGLSAMDLQPKHVARRSKLQQVWLELRAHACARPEEVVCNLADRADVVEVAEPVKLVCVCVRLHHLRTSG